MDPVGLAGAFVAAAASRTQIAAAASMMKMNADAAASIVKVIEEAQQNIDRLANVAAGIGGNVDITV